MPGSPDNLVPTVLIFLVGWRVYGRFRRNIGPQLLKRRRMMVRIGIYAVLSLVLGVFSLVVVPRLAVVGGLLGGLALGVPLGLYGLHLTRFETRAEGHFYTPNPYMGVGLSLLLAVRVGYRLVVFSGMADQTRPHPQLMQSPLTLFFFGLLAGYYMAYFSGVLVRSGEK
jgi:hypothetical protein